MIKRKFVSARILKPGMVIDQSIADQSQRVLVARKTVLDEYLIAGIQKMNISGVYIAEGTEEDETEELEQGHVISPAVLNKISSLQVPDLPKINFSEQVKKRVSEGMNFLFNNPTSERFVSEAEDISNELLSAIEENGALAVDLNVLKISNEYTFKHSVDVASMAMIVAKNLGYDKKIVKSIGLAGILHDIGKTRVPNEILDKTGKLNDEEFNIIKSHTTLGYELLKQRYAMHQDVLMGVLQHHEKLSGAGYPMGVDGNRIHYFARIISVVDIYDALVTERPYKAAFSPRDALEMILAMTNDLDQKVIRSFMQCVILYPVGTTIKLSNGEFARVVENIPGFPMRPTVVGIESGRVYDLAENVNFANLIIE